MSLVVPRLRRLQRGLAAMPLQREAGNHLLGQVRGNSRIPFEEWMELDLQYIDKWSLW